MANPYQPMVYHLTRITLALIDEENLYTDIRGVEPIDSRNVRKYGKRLADRAERVAAMMDLLAAQGFTFKAGKDCIYADSEEVEAQDAKRYLLESGFHDQEFQVYLEYMRKWGVL
jgi:hypothetical protein